MAWFHFKKKESGAKTDCCCTAQKCATESSGDGKGTGDCIQVLGAGCPSCHTHYENVKKAVSNLNMNIDVAYVTDMEKIMNYGVMHLPALVVDGKIVSMGKVVTVKEAESLLQNALCAEKGAKS